MEEIKKKKYKNVPKEVYDVYMFQEWGLWE